MRTGRFNLDYWRQTSDRWRVEFETTRRPLPAPEQLEDMRNQVTDLCADRDYWRQASDHWRVAFETTQRLLPEPVERGTTAVTSWRGVFGQLCSTWAAQLATAVTSWRGVFGQLCSTGAAQLATAVASWRGVFGQLCSTWAAQLAPVASWRGVFGQLARQRELGLGERRGPPGAPQSRPWVSATRKAPIWARQG